MTILVGTNRTKVGLKVCPAQIGPAGIAGTNRTKVGLKGEKILTITKPITTSTNRTKVGLKEIIEKKRKIKLDMYKSDQGGLERVFLHAYITQAALYKSDQGGLESTQAQL